MDQILAEENVDNGADETVQWTLTDHLNTVRDIAKYDPGSDMTTVVNHLIYDAFGKVTSETNPTTAEVFFCDYYSLLVSNGLLLFTGRPFDSDTQLQNNLNRWYDASVGRWLSEDPIGFAAGDENLYRYVGNGVLTLEDPTGLARREVTCTFSNGSEIWSEQIAADTQETATAACQRRARGWGLGTPWTVLLAREGALPGRHKEHGGTWESDYASLRVTCEQWRKDAVAAEQACVQNIALKAASYAAGRNITSFGEAIIGTASGGAGTLIVVNATAATPAVVVTGGWFLIAGGIVVAGKGVYDFYVTTEIGEAQAAAAERYCNCEAIVP